MLTVKQESDFSDINVRKQLIEDIESPENKCRKAEAFKRFRCYKDHTDDYVIEQLCKQFSAETVHEMSYGISNISFVRKIVNKLARVYSNGVQRKISDNDEQTAALSKLTDEIGFNDAMRQANRFLKLQKNVCIYVKPCPVFENPSKWTIQIEVLNPYLYDVVEDPYRRTKAVGLILSDYNPAQSNYAAPNQAGAAGRNPGVAINGTGGITIAPAPDAQKPRGVQQPGTKEQSYTPPSSPDAGANPMTPDSGKRYIFWTATMHFTCDETGKIVSDESKKENQIKKIPAIFMGIDQDGKFWCDGGDDLVDGSILINAMISNIDNVAITQGYGQFYMTGSKLPTNVSVGPNRMIKMEYNAGDPEPTLGFASANPQLAELMGLVEMYVALLLTTNDLSTSGVSANLQGTGGNAASGVAMMVDQSESREDVTEQQQLFSCSDPEALELVLNWMKALGENLDPELKEIMGLPETTDDMTIEYMEGQAIQTEAEKLANLKARKDLGLNTLVDLIMKDNPSFTKEQAQAKLKEILEEQMQRMAVQVQQQKKMGIPDPNAPADPTADPTSDVNPSADAPAPDKDPTKDEGT